jgi:osmotically-inducible protein OsmY
VSASTVIATLAMRRGQPHGPASDQDVEELLYDAIELMPAAGEVEVRCEGGRVSLTGSVPNKRVKRDVGELAWAIPAITDVHNAINIATRRRARPFTREPEAQQTGSSRKQA